MKRYLSVKEAASLLGVSTNTIYTYLKEGKVRSKRIGMGRIKIPYRELEPYIEDQGLKPNIPEPIVIQSSESTEIDAVKQPPVLRPEQSNSSEPYIQDNPKYIKTDSISNSFNDQVFYRIFKAMSLIGLGSIYLITDHPSFSFGGSVFEKIGELLSTSLPFALIFAGVLTIFEIFKSKEFEKPNITIDLISFVVLLAYTFIAIMTGYYGRAAFALAFTAIAVSNILQGSVSDYQKTFQRTFLQFNLYKAIFWGLLLVVFPGLLPFRLMSEFVANYTGVFIFLWFVLLLSPLIFFVSQYGYSSKLKLPYLFILGVTGLIFATQMSITGEWDVSYLMYINSIFVLLLAWWGVSAIYIDIEKIKYIVIVFGWVSFSSLFGLYALRSSFVSVKQEEQRNMESVLDRIGEKTNALFNEQTAMLVSYAGKSETINLIKEGDQEKSIEYAKAIFEKTDNLQRVIIFNKEGIAIGVYPRNSLAQGTNFSSREYFQTTKRLYKGYISPVFETVNGNPSVMHTEPVFENNEFVGMFGLGLSPDILAAGYAGEIPSQSRLSAVDENGSVVFDTQIIKQNVEVEDVPPGLKKRDDMIRVYAEVLVPKWKLHLESDGRSLIGKQSDFNIILPIILFINAVFSIFVGITQSTKKTVRNNNVLPVPHTLNPQMTE